MIKLTKTVIGLSSGKKITIFHDLPNDSIQRAVKIWLATDGVSHNEKALAAYLTGLRFTAFTEKQYKRYGKAQLKKGVTIGKAQ
jgi:hypothetical protein